MQRKISAADALVLSAMRAQYDNQAAFQAGVQGRPAGLGGSSAASAGAQFGESLSTIPTALGGHAPGPTPEMYRDLHRVRPDRELDKGESSSIKRAAAAMGALMTARYKESMPDQSVQKPRADDENKERMKKLREERAQKEAAEQAKIESKRCHLHKKVNKKCKFCQKYQDFLDSLNEDKAAEREKFVAQIKKSDVKTNEQILDADKDPTRPLEIVNNRTFGFSDMLRAHIVESAHFKTLMAMDSFEQVVEELLQYADTVEPYSQHSSQTPSCMMCCLYRLFEIDLKAPLLRQLLESTESPFIRCCGFLYIRFGLAPDQFWPWLGEYVLDEEEFRPTKDSESKSTIGEFVEAILSQEKYYSTILPRLPASTKKGLEEKLAQVPQYRKRTQANNEYLHLYRARGTRVEACTRDDGEWHGGEAIKLDESTPSRLKVLIRFDTGEEVNVHLGKVILNDRSGSSKRRARSRSRSPRGDVDWARDKGRSLDELIEDLRNRDKERAVCTSRKNYSRRPQDFQLALPGEQGNAYSNLMREETQSSSSTRPDGRSTRSPERMFGKQPSLEHQERMRQLFEKYGAAARKPEKTDYNDVIGTPDVMRLG